MEDRERKLYDKLIKVYEDEIARLRAENIKLKVDRDQAKRIAYPINPYPHGISDWPPNQPIGAPCNSPSWVYEPSETGPQHYSTNTSIDNDE